MRFLHERAVSIEHFCEPSLVVGCDGVIQGLNRAARAIFPTDKAEPSLYASCSDRHEALRRYLVCCSGARQPVFESFVFAGPAGTMGFRCFGNVLIPRWGDRQASILLRLFTAIDTRFSAGAERIRSVTADGRWRRAAAQADELRGDRLRIVEQYLFIAEALRMAERQLRDLEEEIQRIRIEERERIAQDLHDQAGQELAAAIAEVRRMRNDGHGHVDRLDALADQLANVGRNLHRAALGGRPRIVEELGLRRAIEATVAAYATDCELAFTFASTGPEPETLSAPVESAIYRVAQEALTNVMKHATGARKLEARLAFTATSVVLTVSDDGAGFCVALDRPTGAACDIGGLGLRGMRQRLSSIAGTLDIASTPGLGTTITATAPLRAGPMRIIDL